MRRHLVVFFLLFQLTEVVGQSPYFQQYFLLRKNDAFQVEAILKDRKGFMWVGTNKGLFRFDGVNTRRFTTTDSLATDHVTALAQDSLGRLWIGHKNGRLSVMENEVIHRMQFAEGDATEEISDIIFTADGTMWFSTYNDGVYYYREHLYRLDETDSMPDIFVYDLEEFDDGSVWAATDRGVAVVSLKDNKASIKVLDYKTGFPDNIIKKIVCGEKGTLWLATEDAGIFSYDPATNKIASLTKAPWTGGGILDFIRLDDEFWIATSGASVAVYNRSEDQLNLYAPVPGVTPTALFADEEGSVWVGARNGLFRSMGRAVRFIDDLWPSHDPNVAALTVDHKNNIWFANKEGLFKRSTNKEGHVIAERYLDNAPYSKFGVISLFTDSQGFVWAGFYGQGAVRINPDNGQMTRFDKELGNGSVLSITGAANKVWLSTLSGATLIELNGLKVTNYNRSKGLDCDYVYQVFVDSKNRTWFASDREGIAMLDETGFHKMLGALTAKAIYGLAEDASGGIWANVQDDGLYKFDGQQFQPGQVLKNINVNCLSSDGHGNLIAVHDLGIEVFNPSTNTIQHLDNEIGFGDRKPNLNAVSKDPFGSIYFGTDNGIVIYGFTDAAQAKPRVAIDKFRIFNKYKDWSDGLQLSYDENNVTITFLGFWYQDPQGIGFQYRLDDYDVDWISTSDRAAVFSSLPPGSYTFRVRASANGNFENALEDAVHFDIRPPFWRTNAFYVFAVVALATMAYVYIRARERNLLKEKVELEEKVTERTHEIVKKNEEILAQAEEIKAINESLEKRVVERTSELEKKNKALEEYAFINAHNLRSPVASILGLINLLSHIKDEKESREIVQHLKVSAEKLDEVVHSITESIEKSDHFDLFSTDDDDSDEELG